jgi:hypothetical protein
LNWQPIPFDYEEIQNDMLLMMNVPCQSLKTEYDQVIEVETEKYLREYPGIYDELSRHSGFKPFGINEFMSVCSTLMSQVG